MAFKSAIRYVPLCEPQQPPPSTLPKALLPYQLHEWASPKIWTLLKQGPVLPCPYPRMNEIHIYFVLTGAVVSVLYLQGLSHHHPSPPSPRSCCWQSGSTEPEVNHWCPLAGEHFGRGTGSKLAAPLPSLPTLVPTERAWCRMSLDRGVRVMQTNVGARHELSSHESHSCILGLLQRAEMEGQRAPVLQEWWVV